MKVSMVSVSRSAAAPQLGQAVWRQVGWNLRGLSPVGRHSTSSGNSIGSSSSGTGTAPQLGQWTTGIGQPQ